MVEDVGLPDLSSHYITSAGGLRYEEDEIFPHLLPYHCTSNSRKLKKRGRSGNPASIILSLCKIK